MPKNIFMIRNRKTGSVESRYDHNKDGEHYPTLSGIKTACRLKGYRPNEYEIVEYELREVKVHKTPERRSDGE